MVEVWAAIGTIGVILHLAFGVRKGSKGNRVRISDSTRCCYLLQRLPQSHWASPGKATNVGSKSEDLPQTPERYYRPSGGRVVESKKQWDVLCLVATLQYRERLEDERLYS